MQCNSFLGFNDKNYQPLQTLIDDLEIALPVTCIISEIKQESLVFCFIKIKDCSRSSSITLMELVPEKAI